MNQILNDRITKQQGRLEQVEKDLSRKKVELTVLEQRQIDIEAAQVLLQVTAQETQDGLRVHLEDIVQVALDTCFPGEYTFKILFELKRGSTVCEMYLEDESGFKLNPMTASGGGLVDVISLALRLAVWTLSKPDNVIVLDEPFKFLSANLRPLAGEILQNMSEKLGLQIIMVTHDPILIEIADRTFSVKKNRKGISKVKVEG